MTVFLNGRFVPEAEATISVFDRSFLYGDGLFETVRISNGKLFRLEAHLQRLEQGARFLGIKLPFAPASIASSAQQLIIANSMREALLRITLSRGVGIRGYSPKGAGQPTLVMTLHPFGAPTSESARLELADSEIGAPPRWKAHIASIRLPAGDAIAQFKTCNKLAQVLARAEAESAGADEALLLNTDGYVVEAATGNLFWIQGDTVFTPPLADGILRGITRGVVIELCGQLGLAVTEAEVTPAALKQVDAAFLSLSSYGVVGLSAIDGVLMGRSVVVTKLAQAYNALLLTECDRVP
jgi:branched-chain amino acid aminotransferase